MQAGAPVKLRARVDTRYFTADTNGYNVIAEIPGTDSALKTRSCCWARTSIRGMPTGATDNADASASLLEAMRILKAIGVKPRRTIRMALWGGEEQGLLGSRAYAARHYAGDSNAAARQQLAVYLNSDPGSGPIFGWYMEENPEAKAIFDAVDEVFELRDVVGADHGAQRVGHERPHPRDLVNRKPQGDGQHR
jgi:hypothetical protein